MKEVIKTLWNYAHQRWIQRGRKLNGEPNEETKTELRDRIKALYQLKHQLPRRYQFFFGIKLEQMITRETAKNRRWLQDAEPIIHRAIRKQQRRRKESTGTEIWLKWEQRKKNRRRKR